MSMRDCTVQPSRFDQLFHGRVLGPPINTNWDLHIPNHDSIFLDSLRRLDEAPSNENFTARKNAAETAAV